MKPELTQARLKHLLRLENGELIWNHGQRMKNKIAGSNVRGKVLIRVDGKEYEKSRLVKLFITGILPEPEKSKYYRKKEAVDAVNSLITRAWL